MQKSLLILFTFTIVACGRSSFNRVIINKKKISSPPSAPSNSPIEEIEESGLNNDITITIETETESEVITDINPTIDVTKNPVVTYSNIDTDSRAAVKDAYKSRYLAYTPAMEWTGSIAECRAGETSVKFQQRVIDQINFFRAMNNIPAALLKENVADLQEAALIMDANNRLSHRPTSTWDCYSKDGFYGATRSNLSLGRNGTQAINSYMDDSGANNGGVGHRRWILHPSRKYFATGDVRGANALGVFIGGSNSHNIKYYKWPNSGYIPYQLIPRSNRWSFSMSSAGFSDTIVEMSNLSSGENYTIDLEPLKSNYGWNTIVFKPQGLSRSRPNQDTIIQVKIKNVKIGGESKDFSYQTIIFDPNK